MPRKFNYGSDYDEEDYDDYEDYNHDFDVQDNEAPASKQETSNPYAWRCSICTYDNDVSTSACDICGVLRNPMDGNYNSDDTRAATLEHIRYGFGTAPVTSIYDVIVGLTSPCLQLASLCLLLRLPSSWFSLYRVDLFPAADSMCKDSGVSKLPKSFFTSLQHQTPLKAVVVQQKNDVATEGGKNFIMNGNFQGNFHEFHKAFCYHSQSNVNIVLHDLEQDRNK